MNTIRQFQCCNITWTGNKRLTKNGGWGVLYPTSVSVQSAGHRHVTLLPQLQSVSVFIKSTQPTVSSYLDPHNWPLFPCLSHPHKQIASSYLDPHDYALVAFLKHKCRGFPSNLKCGEVHSSYLCVASPWETFPKHSYQLQTLHLSRQSRYVFVDACRLLHLVGFFFPWVPSTSCCPQPAHHTVGFSPLAVRANN
jgi:hypothetical protein